MAIPNLHTPNPTLELPKVLGRMYTDAAATAYLMRWLLVRTAPVQLQAERTAA